MPLPYQQHRPGTAQTPFYPPPPRPNTSATANNDSHLHYRPTSARQPFEIPTFPPRPPSSALHHGSSAVPRHMPTTGAIGLDESIRLPPSRQPDTAATMLTAHAAQASKQPALPFGQGYEESANPMLGPTQHSAMPSQLFSFPSSARQPTSAAHSDREDDQSQAQPYRNGLLVPETHAPGGIRGVKAQGHWSPAKPNGKKEDAGDVGEEGGSRTASEGSRLGEGRNADESGIHAPRPSRAIDVRGMDYAAGRKESFPLGTPPLESQYATQSQHPQQTNKIGAAEGGRTADKGDSDGAVETQLCSLSQMNRGQQHGQYSESQGRPMKRTRSFGEHQQSNQHDSSQSQSQYQPSKHARVDSYYPSAAGPSFRQPLPPALSRGQAYTPTPVLASNHARTPDMTRAASSRPFAIPASRQNVAPLPSTPAWRPQNSTLGQKVRNPAELFMAVAQQGAEGKAKTTSERILSRIDEVFVQLMEQLSSTVTMQQQGRDQLHDLRLGQRALATREEIVEDIAGQLTPALQECFQTLTTNIAQMLEPVARDTADLVVDEIKNAMIEQKKGEAVEKAKDNEAQKPLSELVTHLVKKLDTVGNIATFLDSCKDLPDVLRDVAVYKQSLDAVTAMVQKHAQGIQGVQGAMSVQAMYEELKGALQGIGAKLGAGNGALVGAGAGAGGLGEILASVRALDQRISTVMPTLPSVLSPLRAPQLSPSSETTLLSRKVDHLNSQLASLKDMLVQQHANPPQLDIPSIVQQLRQAIMAPSVEDSHIGEVTRATSPANQMQVVQTQQNDLPSAFDYSQILQSTQMGSTQLPDHLVTPVTSMRHGTLPAHGQGQTDMYGHNQHLQNGFTFSPYDWQNQGHGDLAMTLGMGAGEGSQYTNMPLPIDGGGSGFIHVPQGMLRSTEGLGGLGMQRSGRYNSDQRQGEGEAPEQDQQEGITLMRTASDHPINDFRLGQAGLQGDDRFNLSGPELGLSVLAGEADVFGQIQNIGSTPAVGSSTSAFVSHARARHDQQSQPPAFRPYYPTLPAEMGGGANPPSSPAHTIAEHSAMLGEDEEESFVDEYADIFDNPGPKPNVTPIGGRKTSGNSTGTGTGKGKGKRRAAPSPVPAPTPMRTPANKKGRGSPAKTASPALTPGMQPVSKRTRKGSALVPSALEQAAKASARPGMPGTPGTASAGSPTRNISDDAVDRFGVPRRLSDRIARRSSAAVTDSPASALSGRGTRAGDSADDAIRLSSDSSGPSGLSGSSKANSRNSKQVKQELLDGLMQQGQGDNGKTGGSGEAAGELGLAVHVEEQEEDGDESSMDAQTAQSTREWARIQEEQRLIMGTGKKAVTYGGRKKRVVNALDSEESE